MDWSRIYTELKGWQGGIATSAGFITLVLGALFNAHLNRRRDERLRAEETVAVAAALYAEIVIVRRSLARMVNSVANRYFDEGTGRRRGEPFDCHFLKEVELPPLRLYPALGPKVGLLPSQIALEVVSFYSRAEEAQTWLRRLPHDPTRPYSYGVNYVLDPAIAAVLGVLPALREIEAMAGISSKEGVLDVSLALDVQELEQLKNEG